MRTIILLAVVLLCLLSAPLSMAQDKSDKVKAVFLFKFTGYIAWPDREGGKLTLCTYDGNPFGSVLEKIGALQKSAPRIKHIKAGGSLKNCDLVYMLGTKSLPLLEGQPVLTVSDDRGFAKDGGMIEMHETTDRIKLIINVKELKNAGLKASSRLLELAEVIR